MTKLGVSWANRPLRNRTKCPEGADGGSIASLWAEFKRLWRRSFWAWLLVFNLSAAADNWPCWRGPRLDGTSVGKNVPVHWGVGSNVVWTAELPGAGRASPIVWGNRIFIATAIPDTQERLLLCLGRSSGSPVWQKAVLTAPLERKNSLNSFVSSTPPSPQAIAVGIAGDTPALQAARES